MRDRIGANLSGDFNLTFGDQRACNRGAKQVFAFVDGIAAKHRKHKVADELFSQVVNKDLFGFDAKLDRFCACGFEFFALTDISRKGNDFALVGVLQPFKNN